MCTDNSTASMPLSPDDELGTLTQAFLAGEPGARERLAVPLTQRATATARDFLGSAVTETDDIAQDSVVSVVAWLERRGRFSGNLVNFTIAVTRNRCRNYLTWQQRQRTVPLSGATEHLSDKALNPLDALLATERISLLQAAVDNLDLECRNMLHEIYFNGRRMADLQRESGLGTLQGMYKRRAFCLEKIESFLKKSHERCSSRGEQK